MQSAPGTSKLHKSSLSCAAACLVKVTANILEPTILPSDRIFSTRRCIDHVFPVPGPATQRILFAVEFIKSSWPI